MTNARSSLAFFVMFAVHSLLMSPAAHADPPVPRIQWSDTCPPAPPGSGYGDDGQKCAMIEVPLDYRRPNGDRISIAVSMIPAASPAQRRGVLFLNPGGPGGAGLDMPRMMVSLLGGGPGQAVLDRYDLIGFDPRFVGRSTPATCGMTAKQADQAFVPLEQDHSFDATATFNQQVAAGCIQKMGESVRFATTANTARDMDAIRRGLREDRISYFAYSYGTYLGAVYASLYPDNTDRFVIDSNVDPDWVWRTTFRAWGPGGQLRFPDFAAFTAARDSTYHFGSTPDEVSASYFRLYGQVDANPVGGVFLDGTLVNGPMFSILTFSFLENDAYFDGLAGLWSYFDASSAAPTSHVAAAPLSSPVLPRDIVVPDDNQAASGIAVVCDDVRWSRSVSQYEQEYEADKRAFPMFGALGSNIFPCAFWPYDPVEPLVAISSHGRSNILMLQNVRDPATPYDGALGMHAALGRRSRLVTVDGGGHAIYGYETNSCATDIATAYLADGVFPAHDVFCPSNPSPTVASTNGAQRVAATAAVRRSLQRLRWRQPSW